MLKIELSGIDEISEYKNNAKEHPADQVAQIAASIEAFGFNDPIAVDENGTIIEGHGRLMAAKLLGMDTVPIIRLEHLSEDEKRAYIIAHNKLTMNSGFDERVLAKEIQALVDGDFSLDLVGFSGGELEDLGIEIEKAISGDDDAGKDEDVFIPASNEDDLVIRSGDVIEIGHHRLLVGDSGSVDDVENLMGEELADMSISDPPYGVAYRGATKDALTIQNDDVDENQLRDLVEKWYDGVDAAVKRGGYVVATVPAGPLHLVFAEDWRRRGWLRQILVWVKSSLVLGRSEYHYRHEPILFGWIPGGSRYVNNDRTRDSVWEFDKPSRNDIHPTMKPVPMWEYAIENHTRPGDLVYEPFCGSGTALIACENTFRRCYAMEIDPKYAQASIERWCAHTSVDVIRINGEDVSWEEYKASRQ